MTTRDSGRGQAKTSGRGVELLKNRLHDPEVFVSRATPALTRRARLRLARLIVGDGWPVVLAARRYDVSWPTANRCRPEGVR